jgi:uncharacterized protein (TIGR02647 family)
MQLNQSLSDELAMLSLFNQASSQEGLKVHSHQAKSEDVEATKRLFNKGLVTQEDGGYLTSLGKDAVEHLQGLLLMLK